MQDIKKTMTPKEDVQIKISHVWMTFKDNKGNDVQALKDVNLDIWKGEFISLLGPSGCGKTTLLRIIADLLQPTTGAVRINAMTPREIRQQQRFGIVFQNPVLLDWRTVKKNIELPLEIMHYNPDKLSARSDEMLELVGLTKFADHYPKQLSGGMQQRVGIARALGMEPELLLMDEPFSALDEFTKEKLHMDLLNIWSKTNKTVIFVTHNIQEAVLLSDKICVLSPHPGRLSAVIDVDIERPRRLEDRDTVHFSELVARVRNSFEGGSL